jgi:hypothetical protein
MQKLPIGEQSFRKLRSQNMLYVGPIQWGFMRVYSVDKSLNINKIIFLVQHTPQAGIFFLL